MSVTILYEGQRLILKVSPNTIMQSILIDACNHFLIHDNNPSQYVLKHKRTTIDNSQPFRFSNIPNNSQLDLVPSNNKNTITSCKIAFNIENHDNITESFITSITLHEMLLKLISSNKIPANAMECSPEIVYLRSKYLGEDILKNTTLQSLGVSGLSVRFQLRLNDDDIKLDSSNTTREYTLHDNIPNKSIISSDNNDRNLDVVEKNSSLTIHTLADTNSIGPSPMHIDPEYLNNICPIANTMTSSTASDCMKFILSNNFDVVSIPAIVTIFKYLNNIITHPNDEKYWTINTKNKVFQEKVYKVKGAVDFLKSIGFQTTSQNENLILNYASFDSNRDSSLLPTIQAGLEVLQCAMDELEIPEEDRPKTSIKDTTNEVFEVPVDGMPHTNCSVVFDPYKAYIVRTNPQPIRPHESSNPSRKMLSTTEIQLLELQKRRLEIEGKVDDVQRLTEVLFPSADGTVASMDAVPSINDYIDTSGSNEKNILEDEGKSWEGAGKLVQRDVLNRIISMKRSDEADSGPPLTTKAIKDLQKAQNERIYKKTLIRIKFPDKVCLQGYFHPRHCMVDIYNWVSTCLIDKLTSTMIDSEYAFELYVSPPRTVLQPFKDTIKKASNAVGISQIKELTGSSRIYESESSSLVDLQLVPACVIYLSWKEGNITILRQNCIAIGSYLRDEVLNNTVDSSKYTSHNTDLTALYPKAEVLTTENNSKRLSDHTYGDDEDITIGKPPSQPTNSNTTTAMSNKTNKPKWFKT